MTPMVTSKTGTGKSAVLALDNFLNPFNVGLGATLTGSATFTIEYSFDDPMDSGYVADNSSWFPVTGFSAISASTGGFLTVPCKAVRINVASVASGVGSITLQVIQSGTR